MKSPQNGQNMAKNTDHRIPDQTALGGNMTNPTNLAENGTFQTDRRPIYELPLDRHSVPAMLSTSLPTVGESLRSPCQEAINGSAPINTNASLVRSKGVSVPGVGQRLDGADWDFLASERSAIMAESGVDSARCYWLALADTQRNHGPRLGGAQ